MCKVSFHCCIYKLNHHSPSNDILTIISHKVTQYTYEAKQEFVGECLYLHNFVGYGPNSDSAAAAPDLRYKFFCQMQYAAWDRIKTSLASVCVHEILGLNMSKMVEDRRSVPMAYSESNGHVINDGTLH